MSKKSCFTIIGFVILTFPLSACTYYQGTVSSITATAQPQGHKYFLIPNQTINSTSLQYQEFTRYIEIVFSDAGFKRVYSPKDADINMVLAYGIGDPKEEVYSYSTPTWGQTGISSSTTYGTLNSYGSYGTYSGTTTYTPTYGITGYTPHVGSLTTYGRYLVITAFDSRTKNKELWQAIVSSRGRSDDLRLIFPVLVTALEPYIWKSTDYQVGFEISELNGDLSKLKAVAKQS